MRNFVVILALFLATTAMATGEFSTGGSELIKFKGYLIGTFNMYGEENADPDNGFDVVASLEWLPTLNEWLDAKIAFKSEPTKYTGAIEDLSLTTEDILINMHFSDAATFSMGHFKRPFCYNYTRSGSSMFFRDRAMMTGMISDFGKRDIGANLGLDLGFAGIDLAFTNGAGDNEPEDDSHKSITGRVVLEPVDGLQIAGAFGSYTEDADSTGDDSNSATGIDVYTVYNRSLSETAELTFVGEYMILGEPVDNNTDWTDANAYAVTLATNFELNGNVLQAIRPALRYENNSPGYAGSEDPENDEKAVDFSVNLDIYSSKNTIQAGMRNYSFQNEDEDAWTDMYLGWRMKF